MRLGVSLSSSVSVPDTPTGFRWIHERARAADEAGLDLLSVGDQHGVAGRYYQNTPLLGRLLANWGERPYGCLFLLPLWNPLLVAEQVATLAAMNPARFVLQTGTGHGEGQFAAMGADKSTRGKAHGEGIELVKALLAGETVSSELFGLTDAVCGMGTSGEVEWWIGGSAPAALDRVVEHADVWYAMHDVTADPDNRGLRAFRDACERGGREPRVAVRRDAVILADGDQARRLGTDLLDAGYRGMTRDQVLLGSPADVADELTPLAEAGFEVTIRAMAVPQPEAVETIASLGEVKRLLS